MGYTTSFEGKFKFNKPLDDDTYNLLLGLSTTRRMKRNVEGFGVEGEFFVRGKGLWGQDRDDTIIDFNAPPLTQPGLRCQWTPTEDRQYLQWDGGEKFYSYVKWLQYLIDNVLKDYGLSGDVYWQGEGPDDFGRIRVQNSVITVQKGKRVYE